MPAPAKKLRPPPVVRYEPPTIEEALFAASDLSSDPAAQVEIAAGLMGISEEEVRPHLRRTLQSRTSTIVTARRSVVVERKGFRRAAAG